MKSLKIASYYLLVISPALALFSAIINFLIFKRVRDLNIVVFILCIILSLINYTKVVDGDLVQYSKQFAMADKVSYLEYLTLSYKDPLYYSYKYFFYNFLSADFSLFIFSITFISYFFILKGVENLGSRFSIKITDRFLIILLTAFFPQIFSFSGHLVRQFVAVAIGFYALSEFHSKNNKKSIFLLIISIFIHSSNLIFSLFFSREFKVRRVYQFFITLIIIAIASLSSRFQFIYNGFDRVSNLLSGGANLSPVKIEVAVLAGVFLLISVHLIRGHKIGEGKKYLLQFCVILHLLFFLLYIIDSHELSNRILPVIYLYWPITLLLFLKSLSLEKLLRPINLLVLILFWLNLEYGVWSYDFYDLIIFPIKQVF